MARKVRLTVIPKKKNKHSPKLSFKSPFKKAKTTGRIYKPKVSLTARIRK